MRPRPGDTLLFDTSSAIAFVEELGRLDLVAALVDLGHGVEVADPVAKEILSPETRLKLFTLKGVLEIRVGADPNVTNFTNAYPFLGRGEVGVLVRAAQLTRAQRTCICVLDDGRARRVAAKLRLPITGTIGLLSHLEQAEIISRVEASDLVAQLQERGFRYRGQYPPTADDA